MTPSDKSTTEQRAALDKGTTTQAETFGNGATTQEETFGKSTTEQRAALDKGTSNHSMTSDAGADENLITLNGEVKENLTPSDKKANKTLQLYDSLEFMELWRKVNHSYIPWEQFRYLPMPQGWSPRDVWVVIAKLRKGAGTTFSYPPWFPFDEHGRIWFSTTRVDEARMRNLVASTSGGSKLARSIAKLDGYYFCHYLMSEEFFETCRLDGLEIDKERMRDIAFYSKDPTTDAERVFVNLCNAFSEADVLFADRALSYGLIEDVQLFLSKGTLGPLPHIKSWSSGAEKYYTEERVLELICRLYRCEGANNELHPIVSGNEIARMFWDLRPLPALNACTELILRRIFYSRYGFPGFAFLPSTVAVGRFHSEEVQTPDFTMLSDGYPQEYRIFGIDGTYYHSLVLERLSVELEQLRMKVERFSIRRAKEKKRVNSIEGLNDRERDIILHLLRNPNHEIGIVQHQKRYHTAYATARADLTHLAELGFLTMHKLGRKHTFCAGSQLRELV